jgi:hypothetical protein
MDDKPINDQNVCDAKVQKGAQRVPCGEPARIKVGQSWRCLKHATEPPKERLPL